MGPYNGYRAKPRANCKLSRKKITMLVKIIHDCSNLDGRPKRSILQYGNLKKTSNFVYEKTHQGEAGL